MNAPENLPFWLRDWRRAFPVAGGLLALLLIATVLPSKSKQEAGELTRNTGSETSRTEVTPEPTQATEIALPTDTATPGTQAIVKKPLTKKQQDIQSKPRGALEGAGGIGLPSWVKPGTFYDGKNGGATYRGVTADAIRVLFHYTQQACGDNYSSLVNTVLNFSTNWDKTIKPIVTYFNERAKYVYGGGEAWGESYFANGLYGRKVVADFQPDDGGPYAGACEAKARSAAGNLGDKYFAAVGAGYGAERYWAESIIGPCERAAVGQPAPRNDCTLHLGAFWYRDEWYNLRDPFAWAHWTSSTRTGQGLASWLAANMLNRPAEFTTDPLLKGQPRVYGLLGNDNSEGRKVVSELVASLKGYGITVESKNIVYFPTTSLSERQSTAGNAMVQFRGNGVTTVINNTSVLDPIWTYPAATGQQYYPEWVASSLQYQDVNLAVRAYQANGGAEQARNMIGMTTLIDSTTLTFHPKDTQPAFAWCLVAGKLDANGKPNEDCYRHLPDDLQQWYYPISLLFGIVAASGPNLSPHNALKGLEEVCNPCAKDEFIQQLYGFNRLDHTSVDDHMAVKWDPNKRDISANFSQYEDTNRNNVKGDPGDEPPKGTYVPIKPYPGSPHRDGARCRDFTKPDTCA